MFERLTRNDFLLLTLYSFVLFGVCLISNRALTMHEGVLPQSSAQMFADHDWAVPKNGDAPWLENPPLPQWITVLCAMPFGHCDQLWIVRIGNVLVSWGIVLMTAWMATVWFGREKGLLAGLVMASTCEITRYSWLAEDEIYLTAVITAAMALFVRCEFVNTGLSAINYGPHPLTETPRKPFTVGQFVVNFFGGRDFSTLALFVLLGMTNLVKGLAFGTVIALIPIATYLIAKWDFRRISHYFWAWGWVTFFAVAAAWPYVVMQRYPDIVDLWAFDLGGRVDGSYAANTQPLWYYPVNLLWMIAPWTFFVPAALYLTHNRAIKDAKSPERFLWCWCLFVPLVLTIPSGKHHHYLLHGMTPWAILAALSLSWSWDKIRSWPAWSIHPAWSLLSLGVPLGLTLFGLQKLYGLSISVTAVFAVMIPVASIGLAILLLHRDRKSAAVTLFSMLAMVYCGGHYVAGWSFDKHRNDAWFCESIRKDIAPKGLIMVDMTARAHAGMMNMFYLGDNTLGLQNHTYLLDDRIQKNECYVLTPYRNRISMEQYGTLEVVARSQYSAYERSLDDRLTLFRFQRRANESIVNSHDVRITPLQGMQRAAGPELTTLR